MNTMNNLEFMTCEVVHIERFLEKFNLFYYLRNESYSDNQEELLDILYNIDKDKYKIARFDNWLIFKFQGFHCRLSLERLNKYIKSLNIKER